MAKEGVPDFLKRLGVKKSEWQYAVKTDWRTLMRPGWDLRVRVYAALQEFTRGYRGEFAMQQVGRAAEGDPPKFAPIGASSINAKLLKVAVEEYRRSGKELRPDERRSLRIMGQNFSRVIESMESEDGVLTAVTATKFLSSDEATRKAGWSDVNRIMAERLSFNEARAQKLVVPIRELPQRDRKRLAGKSFLFLHVHPRPATIAALMRRTEQDLDLAKTKAEIHAELTAGAQLVFQFMRSLGVEDPRLAEQLARVPAVVGLLENTVQAEVSVANAREALRKLQATLKEELKALIDIARQGRELPLAPVAPSQAALFPPVLVSSPALPQTFNTSANREDSIPQQQRAANEGDGNSAVVPPAGDSSIPESSAPLDWDSVGRAGAQYGTINDTWVRQIVLKCQAKTPDVTPAEISQLIHTRGKSATRKDSPAGYLMTYVPQDCEGESFRRLRQRLNAAREEETRWKEAAAHPLPEYEERSTADRIRVCEERLVEAREQLKVAKKSGRTVAIVDAENCIFRLESERHNLTRELERAS